MSQKISTMVKTFLFFVSEDSHRYDWDEHP
jgi:hypothetical protein